MGRAHSFYSYNCNLRSELFIFDRTIYIAFSSYIMYAYWENQLTRVGLTQSMLPPSSFMSLILHSWKVYQPGLKDLSAWFECVARVVHCTWVLLFIACVKSSLAATAWSVIDHFVTASTPLKAILDYAVQFPRDPFTYLPSCPSKRLLPTVSRRGPGRPRKRLRMDELEAQQYAVIEKEYQLATFSTLRKPLKVNQWSFVVAKQQK